MIRETEIKLPLTSSLAEVRRRLQEIGASLETPRLFEDNSLYDDAMSSLTRAGRILRLRRVSPAPGPGREVPAQAGRLADSGLPTDMRRPAEDRLAVGTDLAAGGAGSFRGEVSAGGGQVSAEDRGDAPGAILTYKEPVPAPEGQYKIRAEVEVAVSDPEALDTILRRLGLSIIYRYQKYRTTFQAAGIELCLDETPIGNFLELEGAEDAIDSLAAALGYGRVDYIALSYRGLQERALQGTGVEPGDMLFDEAT